MTKLLSRDDVSALLDMRETIDILADAFAELARGHAVMPQRSSIALQEQGGIALFMPAFLRGPGALGAKVVTAFWDNSERFDLPTIFGTIVLLDHETGAPLAIMDGTHITAMRTGGVAGLATRYLARTDASVHTMLGTGGMARAHAWAVDCARDIDRLNIYSPGLRTGRRQFADSLRDIIDCEIVPAEDPAAAVREADIVTLITSAGEPVIDADWLRPGTHVNGLGAHGPGTREIDARTIAGAKVVCDLVDACRLEAGDLIMPAEAGEWSWDGVHGSLGELIVGDVPARESEAEITVFKSVGLAIQDVSVANHVYRRAIEEGIGNDFCF